MTFEFITPVRQGGVEIPPWQLTLSHVPPVLAKLETGIFVSGEGTYVAGPPVLALYVAGMETFTTWLKWFDVPIPAPLWQVEQTPVTRFRVLCSPCLPRILG